MDKNLVYKLLLILFICLLALMYMKKNNIIISSTTLNNNKCPCENFEEVKEEEEIIENFDNNLFGGAATVQCTPNYTSSNFPSTGCYLENLKNSGTKTDVSTWSIYDFLKTLNFFDSAPGLKYKIPATTSAAIATTTQTTPITQTISQTISPDYKTDIYDKTKEAGLNFIIGLLKLYYVAMAAGINLYYTSTTSATDKKYLEYDLINIKKRMTRLLIFFNNRTSDNFKISIAEIITAATKTETETEKNFLLLNIQTKILFDNFTSTTYLNLKTPPYRTYEVIKQLQLKYPDSSEDLFEITNNITTVL